MGEGFAYHSPVGKGGEAPALTRPPRPASKILTDPKLVSANN